VFGGFQRLGRFKVYLSTGYLRGGSSFFSFLFLAHGFLQALALRPRYTPIPQHLALCGSALLSAIPLGKISIIVFLKERLVVAVVVVVGCGLLLWWRKAKSGARGGFKAVEESGRS